MTVPGPGAIRWTTASALLEPTPDDDHCLADAQVVAVLPWTDRAAVAAAARLMLERAGAPLVVLAVQDDRFAGPVQLWNAALARTRGDFFLYAAQDAFAGRYWLRFALQAMQAPSAGLLAFNDGKWFGQLAAFGMVRRSWIAHLYGGRLFHPDYRQHYGDTELTLIARQAGALVYHPHAMLVEVDPGKDGRPTDPIDKACFAARAQTGFDGHVADPTLLKLFR